MVNIKSKITEGWIHCVFIIEMLGKPKEHLESTLKKYIENLKKDKKIIIIEEDYAEPEAKENEMFSTFVELEVLMRNTEKIIDFCFDYMPSSIEIIEPTSLAYKNNELANILNDLQTRLHKYDMMVKNFSQQNKVLKRNSAIFLRTLIDLSLKQGPKDTKEISKDIKIPEKELNTFLEVLVKENKIIKKQNKYSLK